MQTKKSSKADLGSKRVLFFEIGMVTALLAAIVVFSVGTSDISDKEALWTEEFFLEQTPVVPVTKVEVPKPEVALRNYSIIIDKFEVKKNNELIDTRILIPDDWGDDIEAMLKPLTITEEKIDEIFDRPETMPSFLGGDLAKFRNWVSSKFRYPERAISGNITGRVVLQFVVEPDGSVSNISVLMTPDKILSDAAVKLVSQSPRWSPGMMGTTPVRVRYTLPLDFRLE